MHALQLNKQTCLKNWFPKILKLNNFKIGPLSIEPKEP
jgi:hypothetical protein